MHVADTVSTTREPAAESIKPLTGGTNDRRDSGLGPARDWIVRTAHGSKHPFDFPTLCRWADDDAAARHLAVPLLRDALMSVAADESSPVERVRRGFYAHKDRMPATPRSSATPTDVLVDWVKENGTALFTWRDLKRWAIAVDVNHDLVALKQTLFSRAATTAHVDDHLPWFEHHGSSYFRLSRTDTGQPTPPAGGEHLSRIASTTHPVVRDSRRRQGGGTDRARIKALRASGLTLQQIATDQGVTRERIRQILLQESFTPEDFRVARAAVQQAERQATLLRAIEALRANPGIGVSAFAERVGVPAAEVSKILPPDLRRLLISSRDGTAYERLSDEQAIAAIAEAGTYEYPLTGKMYTELLRAGLVDGLSIPRIHQRFGSWRDACERAGVEAGATSRAEYARRWSAEDMAETMADFLAATGGSVSVTAFDDWATALPDVPSAQTVRNCFGGWNEAKIAGLSVLAGRDEYWRLLAARLAPTPGSSTETSDDAGSIIVDTVADEGVDR
ncbi:hypothetical protein ASF05_03180 [Aeromicrobium sp. Leaf245]|nr:hypothetical protein ASF05_03180 [Aeromicrobium sp. Leaf245]